MVSYIQEMWALTLQGKAQGIWFWAAVYTFLLCAYSVISQVRTRSWPATKGELNKAEVELFAGFQRDSSSREFSANASYRYEVEGESYEGKRLSPWVVVTNVRAILEKQLSAIQRGPDGKVNVYYNPRNPKKSFLMIAGKIGIVITALICVLPAVLYFFKYHR